MQALNKALGACIGRHTDREKTPITDEEIFLLHLLISMSRSLPDLVVNIPVA
jgi:hypothetical protein